MQVKSPPSLKNGLYSHFGTRDNFYLPSTLSSIFNNLQTFFSFCLAHAIILLKHFPECHHYLPDNVSVSHFLADAFASSDEGLTLEVFRFCMVPH